MLDRVLAEIPGRASRERLNAEIAASFLPAGPHYARLRTRGLSTTGVQQQLNWLHQHDPGELARARRLLFDLLELATRSTRMFALGTLLQGCQVTAKWRLFADAAAIDALHDLESGFAGFGTAAGDTGTPRIAVVNVRPNWLVATARKLVSPFIGGNQD